MKHRHKLTLSLLLFVLACRSRPHPEIPFPVFSTWEKGLSTAAGNGKPILMVFDWYGSSVDGFAILCAPEVLPLVETNYNVVWAALDNQQPLSDDTVMLDRNGHRLKTIGGWFADFQTRNFPERYRPMYALFSADGSPIRVNTKLLYCGYVDTHDQKGVAQFAEMLRQGI